MNKYKTVRGFRDIYGLDAKKIEYITNVCLEEGRNSGLEYLILPTVEYTELFNRTMESSDLVKKETLSISLKEGQTDPRALRGEGTAQAIRCAINRGLCESRLMYTGSYFRDERRQKGRYKEFRQFGAEFTYARSSHYEEIEMFKLVDKILKRLNISYSLKINNIGELNERRLYEQALAEYVRKNQSKYSEASQARLNENKILRILDSKEDREINQNAPKILDYIDSESKTTFLNTITILNESGIQYEIDNTLVRGLDYYNGTVFEIVSSQYVVESSQVALGGGGRYDLLSSQLEGKNIRESFGFAFGIDRLADCISLNDFSKPTLNIVMKVPDLKRLTQVRDEFCSEYVIKVFDSVNSINAVNKNNKTIFIE